MEHTLEQKRILAAVHRVILSIGKVKKEAKNPRFDSTYATLEQVLDFVTPHLFQEGLVASQVPGYDGQDKMVTMGLLFIDAEGNTLEYCTSAVPVGMVYPKNGDPQQANAQTAISAQTYLARTQIAHVFRLNLTDDDGNEATGWKPNQVDRPVEHPTKSREGKGWDAISSDTFTLKGRTWVLGDMNLKQLSTVGYSGGNYPNDIVSLCQKELLKRVAAGDQGAADIVEANTQP